MLEQRERMRNLLRIRFEISVWEDRGPPRARQGRGQTRCKIILVEWQALSDGLPGEWQTSELTSRRASGAGNWRKKLHFPGQAVLLWPRASGFPS